MASHPGGTPIRRGLRYRTGRNLDDPLVRYLENDILAEDRQEARKIKKQAARYCISQEKLYRRSFSGPYLRYVTLCEPKFVLSIFVQIRKDRKPKISQRSRISAKPHGKQSEHESMDEK
ncbi:hypothetical protein F2Q69_00012628 [Brassica cretica]|uniref:Uncharacterized protein n=1 Tax=Brassica cretica TaxID=69181 RepID=A0A8S9QTW3_BRACR|nr:hypothetical protein F2Q69_00012628 [Brassica cretica]